MVYVAIVEDGRGLISDANDVARRNADRYELLRHSADLADVERSWELAELPHRLAERPAMHRNHLAALAEIARFSPPPGDLLDFGCGWGFFLDAARSAGWRVLGLEPLPGHSVYARAALGLSVITDTLRPGTFPPGSLDVVTAFQVFEHLPDPGAELDKIAQLLRPGGLVVIEVPNFDTWGMRLLGRRHRHFVIDHLSFFEPATLREFLLRHGFEPLSTTLPTRALSVRHLIDFWAARSLPAAGVRALHALAKRMGMLDRVVRVNMGDIVMGVGRKTGDGLNELPHSGDQAG